MKKISLLLVSLVFSVLSITVYADSTDGVPPFGGLTQIDGVPPFGQ